jgi:hypothetical protein
MTLTLGMYTDASEAPDPLDHALKLLNDGLFEEALNEATNLLKQDLPEVSKGSLQFILGASTNKMGKPEFAIFHFLEGYAIIANEDQPALMGHFQDELARILFETRNPNASLFFTEMAISNFGIAGNAEMVDSCTKLKEELLRSLKGSM